MTNPLETDKDADTRETDQTTEDSNIDDSIDNLEALKVEHRRLKDRIDTNKAQRQYYQYSTTVRHEK